MNGAQWFMLGMLVGVIVGAATAIIGDWLDRAEGRQ